jgi:hypothetical protein
MLYAAYVQLGNFLSVETRLGDAVAAFFEQTQRFILEEPPTRTCIAVACAQPNGYRDAPGAIEGTVPFQSINTALHRNLDEVIFQEGAPAQAPPNWLGNLRLTPAVSSELKETVEITQSGSIAADTSK